MVQRILLRGAKLIPAGTILPVLSGPLAGCFWIAGAAAGEGKGLSVTINACEREQLAAAAAVISGEDVCFDLGANVGLYSLLFAKRTRRVVAFEPMPRNVEYLNRTLRLNRVDNVTVVPWAVSERTGLAAFQPGENSALGKIAAQGEQPVATVSLDDYCERYSIHPTVLKMDVEGAELLALRGGRRTLSERHPKLLLSFHGEPLRKDCLELLRSFGYQRFRDLGPAECLVEP